MDISFFWQHDSVSVIGNYFPPGNVSVCNQLGYYSKRVLRNEWLRNRSTAPATFTAMQSCIVCWPLRHSTWESQTKRGYREGTISTPNMTGRSLKALQFPDLVTRQFSNQPLDWTSSRKDFSEVRGGSGRSFRKGT